MFTSNVSHALEKVQISDLTLSDDEKLHEGELLSALNNWKEETSSHTFIPHENFEFGWLLGPRGFVAETSMEAPFSASLCRTDKYRVIASAAIKDFPEDFDFGEKHEHKMRNCFPLMSCRPASLESHNGDNWTPGLENRGCCIGITYIESEKTELNKFSRQFYITVHSCLPYTYLREILHQDFKLDKENREIMAASKTDEGRLMTDKDIITYREAFVDSYNANALEISRENALRLIAIYADLFELELENGVMESKTKYVYEPSELLPASDKMMELAAKILSRWPQGAPIYPFTMVHSSQTLFTNAEYKEKTDFPIGYFLQDLKRQNELKFLEIRKQSSIVYIDTIKTARPSIITDYNTFRTFPNGTCMWYSHCVPTNGPVMVYQGPALGFLCLNFYEDLKSDDSWKNSRNDSFPVIFPVQENHSKDFDAEVYGKCFSLRKGGVKHKNAIEQLQQMFCFLNTLETPTATSELNKHAVPKSRMICQKLFFSAHPLEINRFHSQDL